MSELERTTLSANVIVEWAHDVESSDSYFGLVDLPELCWPQTSAHANFFPLWVLLFLNALSDGHLSRSVPPCDAWERMATLHDPSSGLPHSAAMRAWEETNYIARANAAMIFVGRWRKWSFLSCRYPFTSFFTCVSLD
jgi:hypothetical protein